MSDDDDFDRPYLGQPLINPHTGQLQDYERFPGDNPPGFFQPQASEADRWGSRILMQVNQTGLKSAAIDTQTFIDVRTLKATVPINVQLRFALAGADKRPILPFSTVWPFSIPGPRITVKVNRTGDPLSAPTEDDYLIDISKVFPWDTFTSRTFRIECDFTADLGVPTSVWVEAIATKVVDVATRNKIEGWGIVNFQTFVPASNAPVDLISIGRADRRQFTICNTSTTGNLIFNYGAIAGFGPPPVGVMILPKNTFATYDSPVGGWTGPIIGCWDGGAPDGGALVTSGVFGSIGTTSQF